MHEEVPRHLVLVSALIVRAGRPEHVTDNGNLAVVADHDLRVDVAKDHRELHTLRRDPGRRPPLLKIDRHLDPDDPPLAQVLLDPLARLDLRGAQAIVGEYPPEPVAG